MQIYWQRLSITIIAAKNDVCQQRMHKRMKSTTRSNSMIKQTPTLVNACGGGIGEVVSPSSGGRGSI